MLKLWHHSHGAHGVAKPDFISQQLQMSQLLQQPTANTFLSKYSRTSRTVYQPVHIGVLQRAASQPKLTDFCT